MPLSVMEFEILALACCEAGGMRSMCVVDQGHLAAFNGEQQRVLGALVRHRREAVHEHVRVGALAGDDAEGRSRIED